MHKLRAILLILLIQLVSLASSKTSAQSGDIQQTPPAIEFDAWTRVDDHHYTVRIPSAVRTGFPENDTFTVFAFLPEGSTGPVPVVISLHYWGATDLSAEFAFAKKLNRAGIASVAIELPYHLGRAPKGTRSGELAIQPEPVKLIATMTQAVLDVRRTVDWITARKEFDAGRIGLAGTSLGSIVGSLTFAVEPRLVGYCSVLGGADLAGILWGSSRLVREREQLRRSGYRKESLGAALESIEPLRFLDPTESRPTYLISARYDTVVPASAGKSLIKALPNSAVLWLNTGHYGGFFIQSSVLGTAVAFFTKVFAGEPYLAPTRLYSPTLRLIAVTDTDDGVNVALGLDIWRPRSDDSLFGTLMFTPTGPRGFLGGRVSTGLAIGIQIEQKRTTPAALWSFVL